MRRPDSQEAKASHSLGDGKCAGACLPKEDMGMGIYPLRFSRETQRPGGLTTNIIPLGLRRDVR